MATRFYFPLDTAADVSPGFDSGWNYTTEALRRKMVTAKGASAITVGTQVGPWTAGQIPEHRALDRQYVSAPIAAQTLSISTVKGQLMVREYAVQDNVDKIILMAKVVSNDGGTVRGTLFAIGSGGLAGEFINNLSHRNKTLADGDATLLVVAEAGDRIVVELGYEGTSTATPEASAKWGEDATDLPEEETQTTNGAGWIEFGFDVVFEATVLATRKALLGVGI